MSEIVHVTFAAIELRVPDLVERIVEGIVVPYGETSMLTEDPRGERFRSGSLTRTVKDRCDRVKLFRLHDHSVAVGKALAWRPAHEAGLWAQFRIAATPAGDETLGEVREGMLDAFSIGFLPKRETRGADGAREIIEAQLHEVSLCPIGAYDGARVLAYRQPVRFTLPTLAPMPAVDLGPVILPSHWSR
jgi:Escherichia/Staphylococcus phage prohead protease